jgi:hypothetical protein|tara:strand:- start:311 stop:544 length:234 start_codon:yes stop_codon:yes gene_type:complete
MPTKFKKDETVVKKIGDQKIKANNRFYIKSVNLDNLIKTLNNENTKPKIKQKIRNEITRRGIILKRIGMEITEGKTG